MRIKKSQIELICKKLNTSLIKSKYLSKGNHNTNYLLGTSKGRYILRIENNLQFKNLNKEYRFLKHAKFNFGPKVFLFDNTHQIIQRDYLIEEFIEGKHPPKKPNDDFVISMAKWFKNLHIITKKSSKKYSLLSAIKPYYNNYQKYNSYIKDDKLRQKLELYLKEVLRICKENNNIFANRKYLSLLHNDSSNENIFYKKNYVRLIDWEFTSYGLPERELIYFIDSYDLTSKQINQFLKTYGYPNTVLAKKQLSISYLTLLCSSIGYSLWRMDLVKDQKSRKEINKRLLRDTNKLDGVLKEYGKA